MTTDNTNINSDARLDEATQSDDAIFDERQTGQTDDIALDAQVKEAYESIELSPEAEQRMLDAVLAYQAQTNQAIASTQAASRAEQAAGSNEQEASASAQTRSYRDQVAVDRSLGKPTVLSKTARSAASAASKSGQDASNQTPAKKKRVIPWKVLIPAAACLLLVAGVGAIALNGLEPDELANVESTVEATSTAATSPSNTQSKEQSVEAAPLMGESAVEDMAYDAAEADMAYIPYDPGMYNTEEYNAVEESGFIATATRPLSTFGADVDTASYANLRRLITEGYGIDNVYDEWAYLDGNDLAEEVESTTVNGAEAIEDAEGYYEYEEEPYDDELYFDYETNTIPKGAIRIEEMLNYFTYDYVLPEGKDLFGTTVQLGDCPWNADTKLLVMGFATNPEVGQATAGRNLVFLIDTSGSMDEPNKMTLLQDAFAELTDQLEDTDRVSIVTYSGYEEVVLDGASGSDARTIQRAIDRLRPEGATNGEAGLQTAYEIAEKNFIEGGVNRIILASDGDLNVGMSSESDLHDFVEAKRDTGIYLSVLGFGEGNYKDTKMETLADAGNGNYHYIDCLEEAEKVFGSDLVANLVPLANDVKLQVEFNPAQVKGYRLIGYENRAMADEDFRDDAKDAGDVGPGHQLTVAYEIVLADSKMDLADSDLKYSEASTGDASSDEWLTCTMRYIPVTKADGDGFVVEADDAQEQSFVVRSSDLSEDPGDDWRFAAAVAEFGMVMRDSEYKGSASFDTIDDLLDDCDLSLAERKDFQRLVRRAR